MIYGWRFKSVGGKRQGLNLSHCLRRAGFTLIELLVAATIVALLSAIGVVSFTSANRNARNGKRQADLEQVRAALELYRTDNASYPATSVWSSMLGTISSYVTSSNIVDPKNSGVYVYTYTDNASAGKTFRICANLEPDPGVPFCLDNP